MFYINYNSNPLQYQYSTKDKPFVHSDMVWGRRNLKKAKLSTVAIGFKLIVTALATQYNFKLQSFLDMNFEHTDKGYYILKSNCRKSTFQSGQPNNPYAISRKNASKVISTLRAQLERIRNATSLEPFSAYVGINAKDDISNRSESQNNQNQTKSEVKEATPETKIDKVRQHLANSPVNNLSHLQLVNYVMHLYDDSQLRYLVNSKLADNKQNIASLQKSLTPLLKRIQNMQNTLAKLQKEDTLAERPNVLNHKYDFSPLYVTRATQPTSNSAIATKDTTKASTFSAVSSTASQSSVASSSASESVKSQAKQSASNASQPNLKYNVINNVLSSHPASPLTKAQEMIYGLVMLWNGKDYHSILVQYPKLTLSALRGCSVKIKNYLKRWKKQLSDSGIHINFNSGSQNKYTLSDVKNIIKHYHYNCVKALKEYDNLNNTQSMKAIEDKNWLSHGTLSHLRKTAIGQKIAKLSGHTAKAQA